MTLIAHIKAQLEAQYPLTSQTSVDFPRARLEIRQHWRDIVRQVCAKHGLHIDDLTGPRRSKKVSYPRQEAMYRMRMETPLSYPAIGARLGDRDHTTVMHGVKAHAKRTGAPLPR